MPVPSVVILNQPRAVEPTGPVVSPAPSAIIVPTVGPGFAGVGVSLTF